MSTPGIDVVYYGNHGRLEYDLVVAPGADPTQIMLAFDGAEQVTVDEQGDLVLTLLQSSAETAEGAATVRLHKPIVYQKDELGEKHLLAGTYMLKTATADQAATMHLREKQHVAFQIASYDASKPLIIDPVLSWATYLGGSSADIGGGIAVDAEGNSYITGPPGRPTFQGRQAVPSRAHRLAALMSSSRSSMRPARRLSIRPLPMTLAGGLLWMLLATLM